MAGELEYPEALLVKIESFEYFPWTGIVWRHMFGDYPPTRQNSHGARWNPANTAAIYTSLERETAIAEGDYAISIQPFKPRTKRTIYEIRLKLNSVVDLSSMERLLDVGITRERLEADDYSSCQVIGGAVEWLGRDGLIVPSARSHGKNLVILPANWTLDEFEIIGAQVIDDGSM